MNENKDLAIKRQKVYLTIFSALAIQGSICIFDFSSPTSDSLSLVLYLIIFIVSYFYSPEIFLKYLWFIVTSTWGIVAVYMLENGAVSLRGKTSYHYGSMPIYVLSWLVFYAVILIYENKRKSRLLKKTYSVNYDERMVSSGEIRTLKIVAYTMIVALAICFLSVINKPYFIYGIDRFQYNQNIMPKIVSSSMQLFYAFLPIPLMLRKENKWAPIIYCGLFFTLCAWCGEKFTGLLVILYFVFISLNPTYVGREIAKHIKKVLVLVAILIFAMLAIVFVQQIVLGQQDFGKYLADRIAAQGELWWLTYAGDKGQGTHFEELFDEISILINQPHGAMSDYYFGIYKMMKLFMKSDWVIYALTYGSRATESTRATFYYYGKISGLLIGQILLGLLIFFLVNRCIDSCNRRNWLRAIPYMYILRSAITASIMSDFQLLTQKKMILLYLFLLVLNNKKIIIKYK